MIYKVYKKIIVIKVVDIKVKINEEETFVYINIGMEVIKINKKENKKRVILDLDIFHFIEKKNY